MERVPGARRDAPTRTLGSWSEIEPEFEPYVDRSLARHAWCPSVVSLTKE